MNKASLKIMIISPNFPKMSWPCGVADFVMRLAINLSKENQVTILTTNSDAQPLTAYPSINLKIIPGRWTFKHAFSVWNWVRKQDADIIDLQYETEMFRHSFTPFLVILGLRFNKAKKVITLHSTSLPRFFKYFWRIVQMSAFESIVFYSRPFLERMKLLFPWASRKFELMGFPSNILRSQNENLSSFIGKIKAGWLKQGQLGVYFGHINLNRGIENILELLVELKNKDLFTQFVFLGQFMPETNDYHRQLIAWIQNHDLVNQVSFAGELTSDQVSQVLKAADYCLLPFSEGVSFKNGSFAAAVEHEVPVITTVSEITEQEILDCPGIITWKKANSAELLAIMITILSDSQALPQMKGQIAKLRDFISWGRYSEMRNTIYKKISL
jgi:glycosyltransferase involved in cell wall biosynthesis